MQLKKRVTLFLWLTGLCGFVILGALDFLWDGVLHWAHLIWLGVGIAMVVVTAAIALFSSMCSQCGMVILAHDNYCRKCGKNLLLEREPVFSLQNLTSKDK